MLFVIGLVTIAYFVNIPAAIGIYCVAKYVHDTIERK